MIVKKKNSNKFLKEVVIRLDRLSKTQMQNMDGNAILNVNDNNIQTSTTSNNVGIQTRSMKRKRVDVNSPAVPRKEIEKPKPRRVRKLTIKERIKIDAPDNEFMANEVILATIPGFCAWPARIIQILNETIIVEFFGTGQRYVH